MWHVRLYEQSNFTDSHELATGVKHELTLKNKFIEQKYWSM